jgi:glycosyltransferase involved in cell wall biosynthesis
MKRKIVFINQATGYLTIDIINEFSKIFDDVALITGSIRIQNDKLHEKVKVDWICKYDRGNSVLKAISWIRGTIQIQYLLRRKYLDYERFYFTIPPTAYLFAEKYRTPFSIAVYDLFPDTLRISGIRSKSLLSRWWAERNKKVFSKAWRIYALSHRMECRILKYTSNKVHVIPNWTAFSGYIPISKEENQIIKREQLGDKFIVQYSGNIGSTHNVETILEVAELLRDLRDIEFQIIGRGDRTKKIGEIINRNDLKNCKLLPFRKDDELFESLCCADLAVVTLDERTADVSVPSKIYNLMAAGVPIMAIADGKSAVAEIIKTNDMGKSFKMNDIQGMRDFIVEMKETPNLRFRFAEGSYKASKNHTKRNAAEYLRIYEAIMQ